MQERSSLDFEPEIIFPESPIDAARIFLGAMAYPERGAGQPGGAGVVFTEAMSARMTWSRRKAKGLRQIRRERGNPEFSPPQLREFEGTYFRGVRRLRRRQVAYGLVGTQMFHNFFAAQSEAARLVKMGKRDEALIINPMSRFEAIRPEIWVKAVTSPKALISRNIDRWASRFGVNKTGSAADSEQKAKDLVKRAYAPSRPVLHMAYAIDRAATEFGPAMGGWDEGDNVLVMLVNCERWIWQAIEWAERWRTLSASHFLPGWNPEQMIVLSAPQKTAR